MQGHGKVIQDSDLIEMMRKQIDSISAISEKLKTAPPYLETGARLANYVSGLRKSIDLLEKRISRAR